MFASDMALSQAKWVEKTKESDRHRFGVAIASGGIGSLEDIVESSRNFDTSYKRLSPYFVPKILVNMAAGTLIFYFVLCCTAANVTMA